MNELLYHKFIDEMINTKEQDLLKVLVRDGVYGLLGAFERWLEREGYTVYENGEYKRINH